MRANTWLGSAAALIVLLSACNRSDQPTDAGTQQDAHPLTPSTGTCDAPVDLLTAATRNGSTLTIQGSTAGAANTLHPNPGCAAMDDAESVFRYHFGDGVAAIRVSTEGSAFDTVLYARAACSQPSNPMDIMDLACNNDSYDHAPQSLLFVTHQMGMDDVFIVVDGTADAMMSGNGDFTLTVTEVPLGAQGNPCRPDDGMGGARCDAPLRCSEGGGPDGTALCVPTVGTNAECDPHGFTNTCAEGATCASDPTPADATQSMSRCALPGTAAGSPCRPMDATSRCDAPLVCGTGDSPICVRVLRAGDACDTTGAANQCPTGSTCRATGDAGDATCSM